LFWSVFSLYSLVDVAVSFSRGNIRSFNSNSKLRFELYHSNQPLKVLLMVEPSPFTYVSGYANRFREMLYHLNKTGDKVEIITTDEGQDAPDTFLSYRVHNLKGFSFPLYRTVRVSFDLAGKTRSILKAFVPDLIHVSTPSALALPALLWSKLYKIPLVMSYHTDLLEYAKTYVPFPGAIVALKLILQSILKRADLVLTTSDKLKNHIESLGIQNVQVWQKGINREVSKVFLINRTDLNQDVDIFPKI
jgi:sulfoquinovosyltransferase